MNVQFPTAALITLVLITLVHSHIMTEKSFYRRPLPSTCTALSSREGQILFKSAFANNGLKSFFLLIEQLSTQSEPAYCGMATLVVVLNALSVDPGRTWKGPWRWYEDSMLNCCLDLEKVKESGITLMTFVCLAKCQGLTVSLNYGQESTIDDFRQAVKSACVTSSNNPDGIHDQQEFLVVSYCRKTVGQTGSGHFSPVAAYDETSDSVLILDTARFKYGPHWLSLKLLFDALQPIDPDTNKSRGYILLSHDGNAGNKYPHRLPISILFRSSKSQNLIRQQYKAFLSEREDKHKPITYHDVLKFWTKDGKDNQFIWKIVTPQLCPKTEEENTSLQDLKSIIAKLLSDIPDVPEQVISSQSTCIEKLCCEKFIHISAAEAIYVIYLASIRKDRRKELVFADNILKSNQYDSECTKNQLLDEAELVQFALDVCDME